jgi:hypothetical protein
MPLTLRAQRLLAEPQLVPGEPFECTDRDGREVCLRVTWAQPKQGSGRWVNGKVDGQAAVVWVSW